MKTTKVGQELIRKGFFRVSVEPGYIKRQRYRKRFVQVPTAAVLELVGHSNRTDGLVCVGGPLCRPSTVPAGADPGTARRDRRAVHAVVLDGVTRRPRKPPLWSHGCAS